MEQKLQKVAEDFLKKIQEKLPTEKADKPCIIGIVGMIGSGKSLFCRELASHLKGAVLIQSDSVRFLLKRAGLEWGPNVREVNFYAAQWLIQNGYTVIFTGDQVDKDKRERAQKFADESGVKFYLLHIVISPQTAEKRLEEKYNQPHEETFEEYWCDDNAEGMKQNMRERILKHQVTEQEKPEYVAEFSNEGSLNELKQKAIEIAKQIMAL